MARALKVCSTAGCPTLVPSGRCDTCKRPSAAKRGYDHRWRKRARAYLARHPFCVVKERGCTHLATVADHYPTSRRDLVTQGVRDPDADHRLRPSCHHCHSVETARHQPGGWHAP